MPPGARGNFVFSQTKNFFLCSFRGELGKVMSLCLSTEACSLSEVCEAGFLNLPGSDVRGLGEMVLLVPCSKGRAPCTQSRHRCDRPRGYSATPSKEDCWKKTVGPHGALHLHRRPQRLPKASPEDFPSNYLVSSRL